MHEDAIFRLASVTKPLVAATALALIERGTLVVRSEGPRMASRFPPAAQRRPHAGHHDPSSAHPYRRLRLRDRRAGRPDDQGEGLRRSRRARPRHGGEPPTPRDHPPLLRARQRVALRRQHRRARRDHREGERFDAGRGRFATYVTGPLGMADTAFAVTDRARLAAALCRQRVRSGADGRSASRSPSVRAPASSSRRRAYSVRKASSRAAPAWREPHRISCASSRRSARAAGRS